MIDMRRVLAHPNFRTSTEVTVSRPSAIVISDSGDKVEPTYETSTISAVVQPAGPDDLKLLPEGNRLQNTLAVWSPEPLYTEDGKTREADIIVYRSVNYRVMHAFDRSDNGFYKVLAQGYVS
jgi:hypothetical protein